MKNEFRVYNAGNIETHNCKGIGIPTYTTAEIAVFESGLSSQDEGCLLKEGSGNLKIWTGASFEDVGGGGGASAIPVTFAGLQALISASGLVAGQSYLIEDYETKHKIDNLDILNDNGSVEPLYCFAISGNKIAGQVFSSIHSSDFIIFDVTNDTCEDTLATPRTGKIVRRIDTVKNISTFWDFRKVQVDRSGTLFLSIPTDAFSICVGICTILGVTYNDLKLGSGNSNQKIGDESHSNTIGNSSYSNTIGEYSTGNTIGNNSAQNAIGNSSSSNVIEGESRSNAIGNSSSSNVIEGSNNSNVIGDYSYSNTIGNGSYSNTIGDNSNTNAIGRDSNSNAIGNSNNSNVIGDYSYSNTIGDNSYSNTIGDNSYSNTIGDNSYSNTIGDNSYSNTIGDNSNTNAIPSSKSNIKLILPISGMTTFADNGVVYDKKSPDGNIWGSTISNAGVITNVVLT